MTPRTLASAIALVTVATTLTACSSSSSTTSPTTSVPAGTATASAPSTAPGTPSTTDTTEPSPGTTTGRSTTGPTEPSGGTTSTLPASAGTAIADAARAGLPPAGGAPVPLTEDAPRSAVGQVTDTPYLAFRLGSGWTQTIVDDKGYDQWKQPSSGCQVTTYNAGGRGAGTDAAATTAGLDAIGAAVARQSASVRLVPGPDVVVPRSSGRPLAFATRRMDYRNRDTKSDYTTMFLMRALTRSSVELTINVSCPTAALRKDPRLLDDIAKHAKVVSALAPR